MKKKQNGSSKSLDNRTSNPCFRVLFWNAGGLTLDKFSELKFTIFNEDADAFGIVECGASSENMDCFGLHGYQSFTLKRSRQVASGIIIYVKDSLIATTKILHEMTEIDKLEAFELRVWKGSLCFHVIFLYNPPQNKPNFDCFPLEWNSRSLILGDFNAHSNRWGYRRNCPVGNIVEDFVDSGPLQYIPNLHGKPTFLSYGGGTSSPDLLFAHTNLVPNIHHILLNGPGGAGHKILSVKIEHSNLQYSEMKRTRWNLKKADWKEYTQLTEKMFSSYDLDDDCIEKLLDKITIIIHECALLCIPRGQMKKFKPFWNERLQDLKVERDQARQRAISTGAMRDCIELRKKHAILKKEILNSKRTTYSNFLAELDFRRDGIRAHQFLSRLNGQKEKQNQPLIFKGKTLSYFRDIANAFNKHYGMISNFYPQRRITRSDLRLTPTCLTQELDKIFNSPFSLCDLQSAITHLTKGKCAGPDEILPEFFIFLGSRGKIAVLQLINKTWEGHFPSIWRKADVIPLLKKKKDPQHIDSFRPISLTCIFCKVAERMIVDRLQSYLEKNNYISERQAGFRSNRSTTEQVIRFSQEVKDGFHLKQSTLAVFVDFKSAFDRVWRALLLKKLLNLGVTGCLFNWIKSFLSQRFIRVQYENVKSSYKQTRQGLPQGSVLSPYLFNIMINDVLEKLCDLQEIQVLLYADDLVIWSTGPDIQKLELSLNRALIKLADWSDDNEMLVNPEKTTFQLFTLSTKKHSICLNYKSQPLLRTENSTYLGIVLDSKLNWSNQVKMTSEKVLNRMKLLKRLSGITWGASQDVLTNAYKSYVRPIFDYGSEPLITATNHVLSKLDITQNCALRLITGAAKSTPIVSMELQTNIEPLSDRRDKLALFLREKLLRRNDHYWNNYKPAVKRLKSQSTFFDRADEISGELDLPTIDRQPLTDTFITNYLKAAEINLELILPCKKRVSSELELKSFAIATIYERYPLPDWLHVYTDGSADPFTGHAGAGAHCQHFHLKKPIGAFRDNFDGEISAVLLAAEALESLSHEKVVFFIDSQAAIQALANRTFSSSSEEVLCKETIGRLIENGKRIVLQWIPGHVGVPGNEEADALAKSALLLPQHLSPLPMRNYKTLIKTKSRNTRKLRYCDVAAGKSWECLLQDKNRIPPDLPRKTGVACFRMLTGHDFLQQHLNRIGVAASASCPLCGDGPMNGQHLLLCSNLKDVDNGDISPAGFSRLYWTARQRMAEWPRLGVG